VERIGGEVLWWYGTTATEMEKTAARFWAGPVSGGEDWELRDWRPKPDQPAFPLSLARARYLEPDEAAVRLRIALILDGPV